MGKDRRECHLSWKSDILLTGFRGEVEEAEGDRDRKECHLSLIHDMSETDFREVEEEAEEDRDRKEYLQLF